MYNYDLACGFDYDLGGGIRYDSEEYRNNVLRIDENGYNEDIGNPYHSKTTGRFVSGPAECGASEFHENFTRARNTQPPEKKWRVDDSYDISDYKEMSCFKMSGGSVFAIHNGDIVSVCSTAKGTDRGQDIMAAAVAQGGVKLDSYQGNHGFYTKCGFEPVSWCHWDGDYAPDDWKTAKDSGVDVKEEDIIFYKYTGKQSTETAAQFKNRVSASSDYDEAYAQRDKEIEK